MSYGTVQAEKMTTESGYSLGAGNASSFKNRLINGGMAIDQRNAGASFTPTDGQFGLDRWLMSQSTAGKYTCQQNAGGVTPPLGFAYYMGMTSTSAYSVTSTDFYGFQQRIEANNFNDWGWGTASAKDATLSFWVYSSLTGTFGGAIRSGNFGIAYIFSYTITAANTWQYVTVPITGPTTGNFGSGNSLAVGVLFSIGSGTNYLDTPGSWLSGSSKLAPTGQTSVVGTNGATFYITGTQFEVGTVATSFDFRSYGTELDLCQRYFVNLGNLSGSWGFNKYGFGVGSGGTSNFITIPLPTTLRAIPTVAFSGVATTIGSAGTPVTSMVIDTANAGGVQLTAVAGTYSLGQFVFIQGGSLSLSAEL